MDISRETTYLSLQNEPEGVHGGQATANLELTDNDFESLNGAKTVTLEYEYEGDWESITITPDTIEMSYGTVTFDIPDVPGGTYPIRFRFEGDTWYEPSEEVG